MAINLGSAFKRTSANPIDESLTLTKAQMLLVNDNLMPQKYLTVCLDDGAIYIYDKSVTPDAETGKFRVLETGTTYDDTAVVGRLDTLENATGDMYTKAEVDAAIADAIANFDKLDYKIADSAPTATKVVINGVEEDVVEGTRYLVKHATDDAYEEYVVIGGKVYDIGVATAPATAGLETALTVSNPIGKLAKDEVLAVGTSLERILRSMLSQTYYPTLTPPSASLSYSMPSLKKVGETIAAGTATVTLNRGSIDPQYTSESPYRSGAATGYTLEIANSDDPQTLNSDDGTFSVPAITKSVKGTVTLTATASYAAGVQPRGSDGADYSTPLEAGSKTASKSVQFILPFVRGVRASSTVADFTGLTEELDTKKNKTYNFTTNNEHIVFAYDSAYGSLTSLLDQNGFENLTSFNESEVTVDGQAYKVYVSISPTTDTNAKYEFKF